MNRKNPWTPPELLTSPQLAHAVIGAWMKGCHASEAPFLKPEHFHDDRDKALWAAVLELESEGITDDTTALVERVKRTSLLSDTDWPAYCTAVRTEGSQSPGMNLENHARIVYENWR